MRRRDPQTLTVRLRPAFALPVAALLVAAFLVLGGASSAQAASAKGKGTQAQATKGGGGKAAQKKLVCKGKGKQRTCRRVAPRPVITSRGVADSELRTAPAARPSGRVHIVAGGREVEVNIFNPDGSYNQGALAKLDELWACRRTKEVRAVDPRLYEVLSTLNDTYGVRVELASGFRYQRNEGSRHFHASAMDIKVPGVSWRDVASFVETLDAGGMGVGRYPNMGFVHVDFRAPGERSVRWNDTSTATDGSDPGKQPSKAWRRGPSS